MATVVVALGGNAILQPGQRGTYEEQQHNAREGCKAIMALVQAGHRVVVTHGNGPQVGNILIQNEEASALVPPMPLFSCGAQTQGQLGHLIQMELGNVLAEAGREMPVVTLITQTEVDPDDPAFQNPSKPIGPFYTEERARQLMHEGGYKMIEDAGRGWRRVVPSPEPKRVVESDVIARLLEAGTLVIASGGGGIPVVRTKTVAASGGGGIPVVRTKTVAASGGGIPVVHTESGERRGVEAVLDKDRSARQLAEDVNADLLMILTDVPHVLINYREPNEKKLTKVTVAEMKDYQKEGHFKAGSMGPKVESCVRFVAAGGDNRRAVIGALDRLPQILAEESGTWIVP